MNKPEESRPTSNASWLTRLVRVSYNEYKMSWEAEDGREVSDWDLHCNWQRCMDNARAFLVNNRPRRLTAKIPHRTPSRMKEKNMARLYFYIPNSDCPKGSCDKENGK